MKPSISRRGMKVIGITLLIYAVLVAPHEGEFWPLSIYPMFSQAGNPWSRAMVLDVTDQPENEIWEAQPLESRTSDVAAVGSYGVDQIDYSNFVNKTIVWTDTRRQALIDMFGPEEIGDKRLMISKVRGELVGPDSVAIEIQPFILITADSTFLNPNLSAEEFGRSN